MKLVRAALFWLHLAAGCLAGTVIFAMAVTGIMLAFERQVNAFADAPAILESRPDSATRLALDSVLASLKSGGQGVPNELVLHSSRSAPLEARFGRERTLLLNPWTGEVVGQPSETTRAFFAAVERFHRSLGIGMQSALGRGLTGAANLAFLFMLLSGICLWLPKIFNLTSLKSRLMFRGGLQGRARDWNWHNVIGIWSVVPLFFIVLTGVVMSYPWASNLLYAMTGTPPPAGGWRGERGMRGNAPNHIAPIQDSPDAVLYRSLDDLASVAKQQVPGWKSITIEVPAPPDGVLEVSIDTSIGGQPEQVSQLVIDRRTARVEAIRRFSDNNAGRRLRAWARFLHTGEEFGVVGETIAALACVGAVMLVWTGFSMAIWRALAAIRRSGDNAGRRAEKKLQTVS